jgi:flagellar basal-body rod protein FlgF
MVNNPLLPAFVYPAQTPKRLESLHFPTWHGIRSDDWANRGLGRAFGFGNIGKNVSLGGRFARIGQRGDQAMENALLVGLSRQVTLERQLDVVANNIANVNTTGFKADQSLFEEYLRTGAHEDNFVGRDRVISYVQDRATFHDMTQGSLQQTNNPLDVAIDGGGFLAVQTAGGELYTRDGNLQLNNVGQLVTENGDPVLGTAGPILFQPTDHDINISPDGTITVLEGAGRTDTIRGKLRMVSFADAQQALKQGSNLYSAGEGAQPQPDLKSTVKQGYIEKSNINSVAEMSRMLEVTRSYTAVSNILQQESDLHKSAIEKLANVPA